MGNKRTDAIHLINGLKHIENLQHVRFKDRTKNFAATKHFCTLFFFFVDEKERKKEKKGGTKITNNAQK